MRPPRSRSAPRFSKNPSPDFIVDCNSNSKPRDSLSPFTQPSSTRDDNYSHRKSRRPSPSSSFPASAHSRQLAGKSASKTNSAAAGFLTRMGQKLSIDWHGSFQVVMVGLDNAGKSTSLYRLKMDNYVQAPPTIGFNCEKFKPTSGKAKGCLFTIWDVGGQEKLRPLWRSYVRHTDAIVFVVDSTDKDRFEEAKLELSNLLRCPDIASTIPVMILCNKQDLPSAYTEAEIESAVGMADLAPSHSAQMLSCCAVTGEGLDGIFFDTLHEMVHTNRKLDKGRKKSGVR